MHAPASPPVDEELPTRWQNAVFLAKTCALRWLRRLREGGGAPPRLSRAPSIAPEWPVAGETRVPLYGQSAAAEFALQAGKVQNLRVALRALHGLRLPAGQTFSFWAHVPRPVARNGFVQGRELREGCIVPSVGGGLCALSNALYDSALKSGLESVERHAHSRAVPGSMAVAGRDATVFWNHVDLRLRAPFDCVLETLLTADELVVRWRRTSSAEPIDRPPKRDNASVFPEPTAKPAAESCETCGVTQCWRNPAATSLPQHAVTAWLVDEWWPEHADWMRAHRRPEDWLFLPLQSRKWRLGRYLWPTGGFARVCSAPWTVLRRSWQSRRLARQGAERVRALLRMDEALVAAWERRIPPEATHLIVSQTLLPALWRRGVLGGRTFDVLMTRLPMRALQQTLDEAAAAHPESRTLADFRAPADLVDAESQALERARRWITPHTHIGALAGKKWLPLDWQRPATGEKSVATGKVIVFPASTLGRKGAWELRSACRTTDLTLRLAGPVLESPDFWHDCATEAAGDNLFRDTAAVVLPAWVEHQPRVLLRALAAGIPVIATPDCGLPPQPGLTLVPRGDAEALRLALQRCRGT